MIGVGTEKANAGCGLRLYQGLPAVLEPTALRPTKLIASDGYERRPVFGYCRGGGR